MIHGIVTSDWHLGSLRSLFPTDHIQRQLYEIDKIYRYAIKTGIKHIFVPGDISDTPFMDYDVHIELLSLLMKYDQHICTYYIAGNHDFSNKKKTSMQFLEVLVNNKFFTNFTLCTCPTQLVIDNEHVNMLPYPATQSIKGEPALNFVHTEIVGAVGDNGRELRTTKKFKRSRFDYTISGHIHQYQHLVKQKTVYCGNPYQKNFGESLPKGFIEIKAQTVKTKMLLKHRHVNNRPVHTLKQVVINNVEDFSNLLDTDSNIRYKVYVAEDVYCPEDLRIRYPNIHNVLSLRDKKTIVTQELEESNYVQTTVSLTKGLPSLLRDQGLSKKHRLIARDKVKDAMSELGL